MSSSKKTLYSLKKDMSQEYSGVTERAAENFIKKMELLFAYRGYFKKEKEYEFSKDFIALTRAVKGVDEKNNINKYVNRSIRGAISYEDMAFFFRSIWKNSETYQLSQSLTNRISNVNTLLVAIIDLQKSDSDIYKRITMDSSFKKKLFFYIISTNNYSKLQLLDSLTFEDIKKKLI